MKKSPSSECSKKSKTTFRVPGLGTTGTEDQTGDFVAVVTLTVVEDVVLKNIDTTGVSYRLDFVNVSMTQGNQTTVNNSYLGSLVGTEDFTLRLGVSDEDRDEYLDLDRRRQGGREVQYNLTTVVLGDVERGGSQTTTSQQSGVVDVTDVLDTVDNSLRSVGNEGLVSSVGGQVMGWNPSTLRMNSRST